MTSRLSKEEINELVDKIVPLENNYMFVQRDVVAKREMLNNIRENLRAQLAVVKVAETADRDELVESMRRRIQQSLSRPGDNIGITVAESFGQEVSQAVLNAKRMTGAGKDHAGGLAAINSVLNGSKGSVTPTNLYFNNQYYTVLDVYKMASFLTNVTLDTLMKGYAELIDLTDYLEGEEEFHVSLYKQINGDFPFNPKHKIRIPIDPYMLYRYQVSMTDIVDAIKANTHTNMMYPIPSPYSIPSEDGYYVDIYLDSTSIESMVENETKGAFEGSVEIFFMNTFQQSEIYIKGIPRLEEMTPVKIEVSDAILFTSKIQGDTRFENAVKKAKGKKSMTENIYYVKLNHYYMNEFGIPIEKLERLMELCGITILPLVKEKETNEFRIVKTDGTDPKVLIGKKINEAIKDQDKVFIESIKKNEPSFPPINEIYKLSGHFFASAKVVYPKDKKGTILYDLAKYSAIDISRCISGDMYENLDVLGVIGMKNFLNIKIATLIKNASGSVVWPLIDLMTSYMTRMGYLTKFNLKGVENESGGFASAILWKDRTRIMTQAAAAGRDAPADTLAVAKFTNASGNLGSYVSSMLTRTDMRPPEPKETETTTKEQPILEKVKREKRSEKEREEKGEDKKPTVRRRRAPKEQPKPEDTEQPKPEEKPAVKRRTRASKTEQPVDKEKPAVKRGRGRKTQINIDEL